MQINLVTLFPAMFAGVFGESMIKRAVERELVQINYVDLRQFGDGRHQTVDDEPYGGEGGMILKVAPMARALESIAERGYVVLTTPRGKPYTQADALRLSQLDNLTIICGHYEGLDERITELYVDEELSIGDYVLTGGEIPAMAMVDSVVRLLPGVLGCDTLVTGDSHYAGLLEHPHYTRPREFAGLEVPEVLLSGDHARIRRWRRQQALRKTRDARPDLFARLDLSAADLKLLEQDD
ncbi:MAG: tRNA (guanine-N(1)-)-methyltransferase [Deltaproteobacteria bacterium ADurb.Bin510]|nr:MAG: tRNA (guanine-N(1)-)-methyltransferase [Deltaproteobacteria bacterium ADurb.Bin510]